MVRLLFVYTLSLRSLLYLAHKGEQVALDLGSMFLAGGMHEVWHMFSGNLTYFRTLDPLRNRLNVALSPGPLSISQLLILRAILKIGRGDHERPWGQG